jgi:hypothetical protein
VEDYAVATLTLDTGAVVRLACSWRLHAGEPAVIGAAFHGVEGGAALRNVDGSFYDFAADRLDGTAKRVLATPPDAWGGRAAADWARRLAAGRPVRSGRRAPRRRRPRARPHLRPLASGAAELADVRQRLTVAQDRRTAMHLDQPVAPQLLQGAVDVHQAQAQGVGQHLLLDGQAEAVALGLADLAKRA